MSEVKLKVETPKGQSKAELLLIEMLAEPHRSWDSRMKIVDALWRIRWEAEDFRKELARFNPVEESENFGKGEKFKGHSHE